MLENKMRQKGDGRQKSPDQRKWFAQAPSNIALIKYMGKVDPEMNIPTNSSFSYTLNHLLTTVELERHDKPFDCWESLTRSDADDFQLSEPGQERFLKHLEFLKKQYSCNENFIVRSANNFPADCGLASSASSYAALTKCALEAICKLTYRELPSIKEQAMLSQQASGSSCRSFLSPWVLWNNTGIKSIDLLPYDNLIHEAIVVETEKKSPSSSEAHKKVTTSVLFKGRVERSEQRLAALMEAFKVSNWTIAYNIIWEEFWDMHALFDTANPPFRYMTCDSINVLAIVRDCWRQYGDGPLVTMDAGPNIHLLYRLDQQDRAHEIREVLAEYYNTSSNSLPKESIAQSLHPHEISAKPILAVHDFITHLTPFEKTDRTNIEEGEIAGYFNNLTPVAVSEQNETHAASISRVKGNDRVAETIAEQSTQTQDDTPSRTPAINAQQSHNPQSVSFKLERLSFFSPRKPLAFPNDTKTYQISVSPNRPTHC